MICPNCGKDRLKFVVLTDAHFEPILDDRGGFQIGQVVLDRDGIECINESVREDGPEDNIELYCPYCHSSFKAEELNNGNYIVGDAL